MANNVKEPSKISERVKLMKKDFVKLRNSGKSIPEIAKVFGITTKSIYNHLQEIADENGIPREDLLYRVHKPHVRNSITNKHKSLLEHVNPKELQDNFSEMLVTVDSIVSDIDKALQYENISEEVTDNE